MTPIPVRRQLLRDAGAAPELATRPFGMIPKSVRATFPQAALVAPQVGTEVGAAPPKKPTPKQAREQRDAAVRDFYTLGNVVPGYGGTGRVVAVNPGEDGQWSADVQHVRKEGDRSVTDGEVRRHATLPRPREMQSGPVERVGPEVASTPDAPTLARRGGRSYPIAPRREWCGDANIEATGGWMVEMTPDQYLSRGPARCLRDQGRHAGVPRHHRGPDRRRRPALCRWLPPQGHDHGGRGGRRAGPGECLHAQT